jgi:murein DD-endopeptidase MepM/ murein hydrolase activator NlpD
VIDPLLDATQLGPQPIERREELRQAAQAFEALFLQTLVQRMRESQLEEGFFGTGTGGAVYDGMFEQFLADELAEQGPLGIAHLLEERWLGSGEAVNDDVTRLASAERADMAYRSVMDSGREAAVVEAPLAPVSGGFGWRRDPIDGSHRFHGGIDLAAPAGTPVLSLAPGRVATVGERGGYGLRIEVEHAGGWFTTYSHLSGADVAPGDPVLRGQRIGVVGNSGRSTGPHLHFEAIRSGVKVDPRRASGLPLAAQVFGISAEEK